MYEQQQDTMMTHTHTHTTDIRHKHTERKESDSLLGCCINVPRETTDINCDENQMILVAVAV